MEFREYLIYQERIPVGDIPGYLIISNDVSKLTMDKINVLKEIHRNLRGSGLRMINSDLVKDIDIASTD